MERDGIAILDEIEIDFIFLSEMSIHLNFDIWIENAGKDPLSKFHCKCAHSINYSYKFWVDLWKVRMLIRKRNNG